MRISGWSSDVCSSDLHCGPVRSAVAGPEARNTLFFSLVIWLMASAPDDVGTSTMTSTWSTRSEEHTSELQPLLRTSYAVFCWKKKTGKDAAPHPSLTRDTSTESREDNNHEHTQ